MTRFSKVLSENKDAGIQTIYHTEDEGESHWLEKVQDVTAIIEANKSRFNSMDERAPWKGDLHHVADIPLTVMLQHPEFDPGRPEYDEKAVLRWLNDKDNWMHRVRPGRL